MRGFWNMIFRSENNTVWEEQDNIVWHVFAIKGISMDASQIYIYNRRISVIFTLLLQELHLYTTNVWYRMQGKGDISIHIHIVNMTLS